MVFQAFAVWPHLDVFDNVAFPLRIRGLNRSEIAERTKKAITYTGLQRVEKSFPNELSGGEKQRIALARAIAINPTVMLLDEPLSNLDPKLREEMRFEIKDLQRKFGFTILYVTHDQAEAMALSHRIMVMNFGVVQQVDTPINIYRKPANDFVFSFIGLSNFIPVEDSGGSVFVEGARNAGELGAAVPEHLRGKKLTLACRPFDIEITPHGGVRGIVKRKVYLGETVDYRIRIGETEIRVQRNPRRGLFSEGDACGLIFDKVHWYERP